MLSFSIGSLPLIAAGAPTAGFILQTPIAGLDSPPHRTNVYSRPGQDGGVVSSQFYDTRIITLEGIIYANNATDFENYRKQLASACAIQKDSNGYPTPTRISFTTLAGNSYFVDAYIDRPIFDLKDPNFSYFQITMQNTNPFIFGSAQVTSSGIAPASGGGFILPVILPITSTASAGGTATVTNVGNVKSYPTITLSGVLTSPNLYNSTVGKSIQLSYTIASGDSVVIDMFNQTITLNNSSSLLSAKTSSSDWWGINPGANQISITTLSTSDTGSAVVNFYPSYLGV